MLLHMPTISAVSIMVSAILAFVLIFDWWRERSNQLVGWWGVAQLIMGLGILLAVAGGQIGLESLNGLGQAWIILSAAVMWMAARQFEGRRLTLFWVGAAPAAFLIAQLTGLLGTFDSRLILSCTLLSGLHFAAAGELSRDGSDWLPSRWLTVILLALTGIGYLTWLPLSFTMPIHEAGQIFVSQWFPVVVLIAMLGRVALAFSVLALVKERQELKQRMDALTDPLTGLPNRRALFEAADLLSEQSKHLKGDPVAVLVFDLDHFKKINDTFGHRFGDQVLQLFAGTLAENLPLGSIVGRLGGEEFAAILPGADKASAADIAEAVRARFAACGQSIDGMPVEGTVSVGGAAHDDIDCDLAALFHQADGALYSAKSNGRNRVEVLHANKPALMRADRPVVVPPPSKDYQVDLIRSQGSTRRFRRSA
jgi:diguanylate cyclase (GGDEF)-like protein